MDLIALLVWVIIFAVVGYGAWWICTHYQMPPPVFWIVGAILLIILLLFIGRSVGISSPMLPPLRK